MFMHLTLHGMHEKLCDNVSRAFGNPCIQYAKPHSVHKRCCTFIGIHDCNRHQHQSSRDMKAHCSDHLTISAAAAAGRHGNASVAEVDFISLYRVGFPPCHLYHVTSR